MRRGQEKRKREYCSMQKNPNIMIYVHKQNSKSPRTNGSLIVIVLVLVCVLLNPMQTTAQLI